MNRGGIIGADWELDDRMTAYDADHVESCGLDGGKVLLRIDDTDPGVARTIESVAAVVTQLADRRTDVHGRAAALPQGRRRAGPSWTRPTSGSSRSSPSPPGSARRPATPG